MGVRECGQKKDSYKRELKEMRAMVKEAHRAGKAAKVRPTRWGVGVVAESGVAMVGRRTLMGGRCSP